MTIKIVDVEAVLGARPRPLEIVDLHALSTVRDPYRTILLQPEGYIEANETRVGHENASVGHALCSSFLAIASEMYADLAVAPEYCVPWSVVDEIIEGRHQPEPGAIWVLGCESISPSEIVKIAERCNIGGQCLFYCEPINPRQAAQKRYVDPLLYVFWAKDKEGEQILVLLAQFKTVACRDYRDIEQTSLCIGQNVYAFNRGPGKIGLISIICSDAFDFSTHIDLCHLNCLLIHIQLNPKPAHSDYAAYRTRLCAVGSNSHVELLCLNWARNIKESKGTGRYLDWNNVAGSAWYAPPAKFSTDDAIIDELHRNGLYYSLLKQRWHSFFLNFENQILLLQKQKVWFPGEQAIAPKSFINVVERWTWNNSESEWKKGAVANDGFAVALDSYHAIAASLQQFSEHSPLAVERAIEVLVGPKGNPTSWYTVQELDAFHLDLDEESIRRVTVHQEIATTRPGVIYRRQRLQRAHDAMGLIQADVPWPPPVNDLAGGFQLTWHARVPHHNVVPNAGNRGSAALIYLGDEADDNVIDAIYKKLRQALVSHAAKQAIEVGKSADELNDAIVRAQDRLCIIFRRGSVYGTRGPEGTNFIDVPAGTSAVDYAQNEK